MGIFSIAGAFLDQEPLKTDLLNFRYIFQTEFVRVGVLKTHLLPRARLHKTFVRTFLRKEGS